MRHPCLPNSKHGRILRVLPVRPGFSTLGHALCQWSKALCPSNLPWQCKSRFERLLSKTPAADVGAGRHEAHRSKRSAAFKSRDQSATPTSHVLPAAIDSAFLVGFWFLFLFFPGVQAYVAGNAGENALKTTSWFI